VTAMDSARRTRREGRSAQGRCTPTTQVLCLLVAGALGLWIVGLPGCAPPPSRDAFPDIPIDATFYTLQPGETLFDLAERTYRDRSLGWALAVVNELSDPGQPHPGVLIMIPHQSGILTSMFEARRVAKRPYNRGTYLLEVGRTREAVDQLERALERAPEIINARYHLGVAYLRQNRIPEALEELEEVVARRPLDRDYRYALGCAYLEERKCEEAKRQFQQALRFDPQFAEAQFGLALTLGRLGDRRGAVNAWRVYLDLNPDGAWAERARSHLLELYDQD